VSPPPSDPSRLITQQVAEAIAALRAGGLVALPTETVYGLGADADNPTAVARIYSVKGRPNDHPLIVHCADTDEVPQWASQLPPWARPLVAVHWPGPLTLVLPRSSRAGDYLTGGQDTVALRVPSHPVMREVLTGFGGAIAAPSANRFGRVSPTTAEHVVDELGELLDPSTDRILDGGACSIGVESTIVDATGDQPRLLRPGGITQEQIEALTGLPVLTADGAVRAPGGLPAHYAPRAAVCLTEPGEAAALLGRLIDSRRTIGLIALADTPGAHLRLGVTLLAAPRDVTEYAQDLYAALRRADDLDMAIVVAVLPADQGVGTAVRDRLRRAATEPISAESP